MNRSYSELSQIKGFVERYNYLRVHSQVGVATFGYERWLNQMFYTSREWRDVRQEVIARDLGCDLAVQGHEVVHKVFIHHMNPIRIQDLRGHDDSVIDPEYLITVSLRTHNAIHYGTADQLEKPMVQRRPGDTKLW
jgi:hypothetical protein